MWKTFEYILLLSQLQFLNKYISNFVIRRLEEARTGNSLFCGIYHVIFIKMKAANQAEEEIEV